MTMTRREVFVLIGLVVVVAFVIASTAYVPSDVIPFNRPST